jgi:small subunit ribosomal protein S21
MLIVKVKDGEKIDRALKRLKRKFRDTQVLQTLRDKKEFTKPSVQRRQQIKKAQYIQSLEEKKDF